MKKVKLRELLKNRRVKEAKVVEVKEPKKETKKKTKEVK